MRGRIWIAGLLALFLLLSGCASGEAHSSEDEAISASSDPETPQITSAADLPRGTAPTKALLAAAQAQPEGLWGYLAPDGSWAIEPAFLSADSFSEGLAVVETEGEYHESVFGYIDQTGSYSGNLHPWFTGAWKFSDGLARVTDNSSDYFYINRKAELAFPQRILQNDAGNYYEAFVNAFNFATDFCGGYALVAEENPYTGKTQFAVISDTGELVLQLDPKYCEGEMHAVAGSAPDENGYCIVGVENGGSVLYGVLNLQGETVLPLEYDEIYPFAEGCFAARKAGLWGFVDADGQTVLPFQFEGARPFSGTAAPVKQDGNWGIVDREGKWLREPEFASVSEAGFSEGLLAVSDGEGWGYLDARGMTIVPPVLAATGDFSEGLAWFSDANGRFGYLNTQGEVVIEPEFSAASDFCSAEIPPENKE